MQAVLHIHLRSRSIYFHECPDQLQPDSSGLFSFLIGDPGSFFHSNVWRPSSARWALHVGTGASRSPFGIVASPRRVCVSVRPAAQLCPAHEASSVTTCCFFTSQIKIKHQQFFFPQLHLPNKYGIDLTPTWSCQSIELLFFNEFNFLFSSLLLGFIMQNWRES